MAVAVGAIIERVVNAMGISSRCWILVATASTLHTSLTPGSRTVDVVNRGDLQQEARRCCGELRLCCADLRQEGQVRYDMYFQ
jgi:hypothetical protein